MTMRVGVSASILLERDGFNGMHLVKNTNNRYGTPCGLLNQKDKVFDRDVVKWWNETLQNVNIKSGDWKDVPDIDEIYFFAHDVDFENIFVATVIVLEMLIIELIDFADSKDKSFVVIGIVLMVGYTNHKDDEHSDI